MRRRPGAKHCSSLCSQSKGEEFCGGPARAEISGRSRRRFELIEFLQRGCGLRRNSLVGLRRRTTELNELTNCWAARGGWADMRRSTGAKHCSSLCSQSEGGEFCDGQARTGALVMFATCSWPSLCEQSELQCWRRNRRLCWPANLPTFPTFIFPYPKKQKIRLRTCGGMA